MFGFLEPIQDGILLKFLILKQLGSNTPAKYSCQFVICHNVWMTYLLQIIRSESCDFLTVFQFLQLKRITAKCRQIDVTAHPKNMQLSDIKNISQALH